ncbi:hypothetical protein B0H13DRAFT_1917175 [Mycena leptocephala]|nr:hypothetical protein B0H13DRAFT_1917175 [Mycena leptocephala]
MVQLPFHALESTTFRDLAFVTQIFNVPDSARSTRFAPRPLPVRRWNLISNLPIYPTLMQLIALVQLVEPEMPDNLYFIKVGGHGLIINANQISVLEDLMLSLRRRLTHMAAVQTAAIATAMVIDGTSIRDTKTVHSTCEGWGDDAGDFEQPVNGHVLTVTGGFFAARNRPVNFADDGRDGAGRLPVDGTRHARKDGDGGQP